jgi:hypothetical protein
VDELKKGWVYVMANAALPGLVKVGLTRKMPWEREKGLSNESTPSDFVAQCAIQVEASQVFEVESNAHELLAPWSDGKEFFAAPPKMAAEALLLGATGRTIYSAWDPRGVLGVYSHAPSKFSVDVLGVKTALEAEDLERVAELVAEGFDPNSFIGREGSFLMSAVRSWSEEALGALLDGSTYRLRDEVSVDLLVQAASSGWIHGVERLLGAGAGSALGGSSAVGRVCEAVGAGHLFSQEASHAVALLVQAGADPNVAGPSGLAPLTVAVKKGLLDLALSLIECGARVDEKVAFGEDAGRSALWRAALSGRSGLAALLLSAGADANARDAKGRCLLHEVARAPEGVGEARCAMAALLMSSGARVDAVDSRGEGLLTAVLESGSFDASRRALARMAWSAGAPVEAGCGRVWPLKRAIEKRNVEAVRWLLARGARTGSNQALGRPSALGLVQALLDRPTVQDDGQALAAIAGMIGEKDGGPSKGAEREADGEFSLGFNARMDRKAS